MRTWMFIGLIVATGCARQSPLGDAELSEGIPYTFANFDGDEDLLADAIRAIEEKTYLTLDLDAGEVPRSLQPDDMTEAHLEGLTTPGVPLDNLAKVAIAYVSPHDIASHAELMLMPDQTPIEPYSPEKYNRTILNGADCWLSHECDTIRTENDIIKQNLLMSVEYIFKKDFRFVDISTDDEPRWAYMARSWMEETAEGEDGGAKIIQSYSIEINFPRDGRGFLLADAGPLPEDSPADMDSEGSGSIRVQAIWSETWFKTLNPGEDMVVGTLRSGIDKNYRVVDGYLDEN